MKTVWKRCPVLTYDIAGLERWLEQMAAEGYLFQKNFGSLFRFEVSLPKPSRRYRMDANPKLYKKPRRELLELYQQAGWQLVKPLWGFFLYYSDDPLAVEPYTDPSSQALSLDELVRECRQNVFTQLFFLAALGLPMFGLAFWMESITSVKLSWIIGYPLLLILDVLRIWVELRAIQNTRDWLADGRPLQHFHIRKGHVRIEHAAHAFRWLLLATICVECFLLPAIVHKTIPLEETDFPFPLLTLAEIEGEGYVPDPHEKEVYGLDLSLSSNNWPPKYAWKTETCNYAEGEWVTLAPDTWSIYQSGEHNSKTVYLNIDRYELLSSKLALPALEDLGNLDLATLKTVEGADYFWVAASVNTIYAARDNVILELWYSGNADLSEYYDEIAAMLTNF